MGWLVQTIATAMSCNTHKQLSHQAQSCKHPLGKKLLGGGGFHLQLKERRSSPRICASRTVHALDAQRLRIVLSPRVQLPSAALCVILLLQSAPRYVGQRWKSIVDEREGGEEKCIASEDDVGRVAAIEQALYESRKKNSSLSSVHCICEFTMHLPPLPVPQTFRLLGAHWVTISTPV